MMENRYFQWIAGDKRGQVMIFDRIETEGGDTFIVFKDGSRIKDDLVSPVGKIDQTGKFMAEIESPNHVWTFKEEWVGRQEEVWEEQDDTNPGNKVCVQPFVPGRKIVKLIPPGSKPERRFGAGLRPRGRRLAAAGLMEPTCGRECDSEGRRGALCHGEARGPGDEHRHRPMSLRTI